MATAVAIRTSLPLLEEALQAHNFAGSRKVYNNLRDDAEQPSVNENHLNALADIFTRNNAHKVLGIHLVHGHFQLPTGTVLLGSNFHDPKGRWAKSTRIEELDPHNVHGHIFVAGGDGLSAYEYQEGPLPDLSHVGKNFLPEFVDYLVENQLTDLIGLQVLGECNDLTMAELILDQATVMLDSSALKGCEPLRVTGWQFGLVDGARSFSTGVEIHYGVQGGAHDIIRQGKPLSKMENTEQLKAALVDVGVL